MKVALITGAAKGIGYHLAKGFADKGYKVIAIDILDAKYNNENIDFYKADLKSESEIKEVFSKVIERYGAIHILINNGAISSYSKSIFDINVEEFDNVLNTNLRGSFICCKEFVKANKGESFGRIINISSTRYNQNEADWEAYGASKGGIVSLTNSLVISLSKTPITVNAISPGWIQVDKYEELREIDHKQHPSGRVGKPSDILKTCLFLCEEDNDFINGANIIIDGGMTKKMIYEEYLY
ncbi:SDR family oxidoreductase [Clostridium tertium]|uniref:SDR family oxidoreductase n=2 Tax=Clostridiaceae TaxID=31979 RepID=A0A9X4B172_9CLOT|nr:MULTISPECIES: SDR family oxidoreductase [Clostridium]MDB1948236.1 SDR family oxidoreductase [Clostridium tertium]MDB1953389.1 SDR family oxidoreductase [Clostridium tertium]MDB1957918.1 SDR family oxidoreductase [Clostridium tertium]MDB1961771.1 SDR family oxidoreductase [Clostridium tertium]MDB1964801.1 SDR family oxidoreductase [Clostridium tertium]